MMTNTVNSNSGSMETDPFNQTSDNIDAIKKTGDVDESCGCGTPPEFEDTAELETYYDKLITKALEIERRAEDLESCSKKVNTFEFQDKFDVYVTDSLLSEEYTQVAAFIVFSVFLSTAIVAASYYLVTQKPEVEKLSTYECGFEPYEDARNKFDIQFYIVAILFVLFDIEIIVLAPWCLCLSNLGTLSYWSVFEFLLELGLGLMYVICLMPLSGRKAV